MGCKNCALKNTEQAPYKGDQETEIMFCFDGPIRNTSLVQKEHRRTGLPFTFTVYATRCYVDKERYTDKEQGEILKNCREKIETAINTIKPKLIICFGATAFRQIMYKSTLKKARNQFHWSKEFNCWVFCTYSPAVISHDPNKLPVFKADFDTVARFIQNNYKTKDEVIYKEVESIRLILDGDCYKEGNFYLTGIDTETQGVNWYDPNSVVISYQVSKSLTEGWTVILHEECEKNQGNYNVMVQRGGTQKKPDYVEIGVKKAENYDQKVAELRE